VLPVVHVLGYRVSTFMAVMVICYVVAAVWGVRWCLRQGVDRQDTIDGAIICVIVAVFGAKLGHLVFESTGHALPGGVVATGIWDVLRADPWHWARIEDPGYVWYGGAIALAPVTWWFTTSRGMDKGLVADAGAPALALGVAVGRLGCFLGGCCYGHATDVPWAVHFPQGEAARLGSVHPTQLYESGVGFLMLAWVVWRFPRRKVKGELLAVCATVYALQRFVTEFFRGDSERGVHLGMGTSQIISIPVFLVALGVTVWLFRTGSPPPPLDQPAAKKTAEGAA
jgi:phosphatidylglycerol:prolipoprotein diacylglycerol transferase